MRSRSLSSCPGSLAHDPFEPRVAGGEQGAAALPRAQLLPGGEGKPGQRDDDADTGQKPPALLAAIERDEADVLGELKLLHGAAQRVHDREAAAVLHAGDGASSLPARASAIVVSSSSSLESASLRALATRSVCAASPSTSCAKASSSGRAAARPLV
jgi:hypothetical protein